MLKPFTARQTLLLVDDEPANLRVLRQILTDNYHLIFAKSGAEALRLAETEKPDLILLDVMMPGLTGFEVCERLKASDATQKIPIIFVTALKEEVDETKGFDLGAVDYITKPLSKAIVRARVRTHLSLVQAEELKRTRLEIILRLGRAAEYKDNETGMHVMRVSHYAKAMALAYGFSDYHADLLFQVTPMHDIGKIGIPDDVLLKPGKLTEEEFDLMRTHAEIGAKILGDNDSELLSMARVVALTHHEKFDGSGYPKGLSGEDIPIEGRIVALADVFDALTTKRPYKSAWPVEKALDFIIDQKGRHFDPQLVELFIQEINTILAIREKWQDHTQEN